MANPTRLAHYFSFSGLSTTLSLAKFGAKKPANPFDAVFAPELLFRFPDFDFDDLSLPINHERV